MAIELANIFLRQEQSITNLDREMSLKSEQTGNLQVPEEIKLETLEEMRDEIIAALAVAYKASGLQTMSGDLYGAAINNARLVLLPTGIAVYMPAGLPTQMYKQAASLNFGWFTGKQTSTHFKKMLKKKGYKQEGSNFHEAHKFTLSDGQEESLQRLWTSIIDRKMAERRRGGL